MKKLLCLIGSLIIALGLFGAQNGLSTTHAFTEEDEAFIAEARVALQEIVEEREILAMVYLVTEYPIRKEPSYDSEVVLNVTSGQSVLINDIHVEEIQNEDGMMVGFDVWEYVSFYHGEQQYSGYIPRYYLACSDERFLEWEMNFGMNPAAYGMMTTDTGETVAIDPNADIKAFPESYQAALLALRQKYPNWTFVAMNTGLDWQTVINNEIGGGKSLVYKTLPSWAKEGVYDDGHWYYASEAALKFYMDPRNHLSEASIFQFEQLTYNESYHTQVALEKFLANTFMAGTKNAPMTDMTFCKIFWSLGDRDKVSPFHLAARVYQEQGSGTSPLISGTYPGYEGYYNYFNIGATGKTDTEEIVNGLEYAKTHWEKGAYYALEGGAQVISKNYILKGQDTLYLQKYNVNPSAANPLYTHQYMQNITAPTTEGASMKKLYEGVGALDNTFVFKIPVYNNMPATAYAAPTASTNVVLTIPGGYSDATVYLDGVAYTAIKRDGRYIVTAPNANAKTAVVYQYNESGVPVGMYVWTLSYADGAYVATAQPGLQNLLGYHGFSVRIVGRSGLRCRSSISESMRTALTSTGINGYTLKDYGTIVMSEANRKKYPMTKGGEKTLTVIAYGLENGTKVDRIYEKASGRVYYTAVLVGLPVEQYKAQTAFRGYATLEKNGEEITIYGPIKERSIYDLAKQTLASGKYQEGSATDVFLKKLISDADAVQTQ